jgi:hypothetical protein
MGVRLRGNGNVIKMETEINWVLEAGNPHLQAMLVLRYMTSGCDVNLVDSDDEPSVCRQG